MCLSPRRRPPHRPRATNGPGNAGARLLCGDSRPETCGLGMGPNQPARGSHVATASFLVDPARQGRGVGRAFGEYVLDWCRQTGFASIQFNAVVASNAPAVHLWQSPQGLNYTRTSDHVGWRLTGARNARLSIRSGGRPTRIHRYDHEMRDRAPRRPIYHSMRMRLDVSDEESDMSEFIVEA
jgi:GNAT superfamily N-acetyltransferase